ncbi:MAG: NfeD family protein [Proteobacteria bacterium]|jgi:membrane protein implicated in regulation of membrane protease activity|nr:NfeD family protein [Pseudomonadota bacterium]
MPEFISAHLDVIIWSVSAVILFIIELATVSTVSIWFVGGCVVAIALALIGVPVIIQAIAAIAVSAGLLFGVRKMLVKSKGSQKAIAQSITDNLELKTGTVSSAIEPGEIGQVMIDGIAWSARGVDDQEQFPEKTRIIVRRHEGIFVYVEKYEPIT